MSADQQKGMEDVVKGMKEEMAKLDSPDRRRMMADAIKQQNAANQRDYEQRLTQFDTDYPADLNALVARRLQGFLDLSGSVDFSAKLQDGRFLNGDDESRSSNWKFLYRAGKPAVDAARAFAQSWLRELKPSH